MIDFHKNELIDETLMRYYQTFQCTLDTADYVPQAYNDKILKYIMKNLKRTFRQIDREERAYQKAKRLKASEKTAKRRK